MASGVGSSIDDAGGAFRAPTKPSIMPLVVFLSVSALSSFRGGSKSFDSSSGGVSETPGGPPGGKSSSCSFSLIASTCSGVNAVIVSSNYWAGGCIVARGKIRADPMTTIGNGK